MTADSAMVEFEPNADLGTEGVEILLDAILEATKDRGLKFTVTFATKRVDPRLEKAARATDLMRAVHQAASPFYKSVVAITIEGSNARAFIPTLWATLDKHFAKKLPQ